MCFLLKSLTFISKLTDNQSSHTINILMYRSLSNCRNIQTESEFIILHPHCSCIRGWGNISQCILARKNCFAEEFGFVSKEKLLDENVVALRLITCRLSLKRNIAGPSRRRFVIDYCKCYAPVVRNLRR